MGYTTFQNAKEFVMPGSGECDPMELGKLVNEIRQHLYHWYAEAQLFADVVETYALQRFCGDSGREGDFWGITLPREVASIESMWWNEWPVTLRSSWREWQHAISPECECGLQKFDLPGFYCTIADIMPGLPVRLRFRCDSPSDIGKRISFRGVAASGAPYSGDFTLSTEPQETPEAIRAISGQGGIVKDATDGRVVVSSEDGRTLGIYEPDEIVPSYRRVKIVGVPNGFGCVNVRAARRYYPLFAATDVVETDNRPAFDSMARYLRSYKRADRTREDIIIEKDHLATAKGHILGEKSRELGKATRAEIKIAAPNMIPRRSRLSSQIYGGRHF